MDTVVSKHPTLGGGVTKPPPTLPTISIPPPTPIAQHGVLIHAVATGRSVVTVNGVHVKNLALNNTSPDGPTGQGEFVAQGTIDLFGNKNIAAEFDIWHGPQPLGVAIGSAAPSVQRAIIKGAVKLSQLIPSLNGIPLGVDLSLQNVSIYHQNYLYDSTKDLWYDLDAELVIDSSLGSLPSILFKVLAVDDPTVHIHAIFGPNHSWNGALNVNTLTFEGSFVERIHKVSLSLQIMNISVCFVLGCSSDKTTTCDVEVLRTLDLMLPGGGVLSLKLD